jgi:sulfatase modifying factor 1
MRLAASVVLVGGALAATVAWAACGGDAFTTGPAADRDGATPSAGEASAAPSTDADAGVEAGLDRTVDSGSEPDVAVKVPSDASMPGGGCPAGRGPAMLLVDGFCVDATEATSAQYNDFLLAGAALSVQPTECSWNASYLPGNGWTFVSSQGTLPIASVNWCDAYAFCKWAGKRLCGKVGGGPADFSDFSGNDNEHYVACSNGSTRLYPYGNAFDPTACNGPEHDAGSVLPVGSLTGCQGGVAGLFDMSGNVEEWQDACDGNSGPSDHCLDGTGAFDYGAGPGGTRCDFADNDLRNGEYPDVGIRCCATPASP